MTTSTSTSTSTRKDQPRAAGAAAADQSNVVDQEHARLLQRKAAAGLPIVSEGSELILVPASTHNLGVHDSTTYDAGVRHGSLKLLVTVTGVWGVDSFLDLAVQTSPTGMETSWDVAADAGRITEQGEYVLTVKLDTPKPTTVTEHGIEVDTTPPSQSAYIRAHFTVGGVGAAFAFSVIEQR